MCTAIAIACAVGTRLLSDIPFFQILNLKSLDAQFVLRGKMPTSNIILLVADKKAFDTFAEPQIFWHPHYARAIEAASEAGAKVIGLDLAFGIPVEKWEPDFDRQLAGAFSTAVMASGTPVVGGYVSVMNSSQASIMQIPINIVASSLGLSAFVNMTIDPDDFVRRQELISADVPSNTSLALRVAEKFLGQDAVLKDRRLTLAGHDIPISSDRSIFINYAGPAGTFPHVSLADFLDAAGRGEKDRLRDWVKGKIVLIGTDSISDRFDTPFFIGSQWNTAGVEVHANTIETILEQRFLVYAPDWGRMLGLLLVAAITAAIVMSLRASRAVVGILIEVASIFFLTQILFRAGLVVRSAELLITVVLCSIGTVIYRFATAERRGNLFSEAISLFVGKQVASTLDRTQRIHLSGKRLTVTIMFTDIRGFTAFTEKASEEDGPEVVVQLLNQYMATMVAIIVKFGGQVNKFIGDGILAVFSDEDEGAKPGDHALRAVRCAARLVMAPSQFETGAGIHTGLVVIGNVGSAEKMEYTVLGDTVNLASRLESLNKENKTRVLMSEATQNMLQDEIETTPIGTVPVRGKTVPITLYTLPQTRVSKEAVSHVAQNV